nr:MFS transporter [Macromonas nakdongensis]
MAEPLGRGRAIGVFLAFAAAYFLSALLRAVTATLAPTLSAELALQASDLGLLAGGYFLGFSAMQLPLGRWLDRHGPKRVVLLFLSVAVAGCAAFAWADHFYGLLAARVLTGAGVSACLMAPLTGYRRWLHPDMQLRANAWMLMVGALGMVAATLPVQWLVPLVGWRGVFWVLAAAIVAAAAWIAWAAPGWSQGSGEHGTCMAGSDHLPDAGGYAQVLRHPYFRRMAGIGLVNYGGMVAIQTLWAGPWLVQVAGHSAAQAAQGLFWINVCMLGMFWVWGWVTPTLARRGLRVEQLIAWGLPGSFLALGALLWQGPQTGWGHWALFCLASTVGSLAQPAVAQAFPAAMAGRALSAYNLLIFSGVFAVQWGIGLAVDAFVGLGWSVVAAFRGAVGGYLAACVLCYGYFLVAKAHNRRP